MRRLLPALLTLSACCHLAAQSSKPPAADPAPIKVTLLGSGGGPGVNVQRYGISILVEAAGQKLLFDCGRGAYDLVRLKEFQDQHNRRYTCRRTCQALRGNVHMSSFR